MKEYIRSLDIADPDFSIHQLTPRILFLLCMEHPLSCKKIGQRLEETKLCKGNNLSEDSTRCIRRILENLSSKGILFCNPDGTYEINREVAVKLRNEIANALAGGDRDNPVALLLRREASNFLARARQIREEFQKRVYEALKPEFHNLRSQRAREIIQQLWDDVDHKRVYASLHSIFDMLPMGLLDFGIPKEKIAFEERFFKQNDEEMCTYVVEQLEDLFAEKRQALKKRCQDELNRTIPQIVQDFRKFLEEGPEGLH